MAREKKAFPLRLDAELHRIIEKWATDEFRSVNGHIEYLLREAARKAGRLPSRLPASGDGGGGRQSGTEAGEKQEW